MFSRVRRQLNRSLFYIAKSSLGTLIIHSVFAYMNFLIPTERLRETTTLVAFYHPKPLYPVHILIVPKKAIRSVVNLRAEDSLLLVDIFQVVRSIVEELGLEEQGYRLLTNGGAYQEVQQLHFHLISGQIHEANTR